MRARYKAPSGTGIVNLGDDATVKDIIDDLRAQTGIQNFTVKHGPPMDMKIIGSSEHGSSARSLGLHGGTLTVVPNQARTVTPPAAESGIEQSRTSQQAAPLRVQNTSDNKPEDIVVPWPAREGTLLLRVMPSDNSCLFTAFGGALPSQISAPTLRRMMADYIVEHSEEYSAAVLGSPPSTYCRSIQDPDRWGGGIELSVLSSIFDVQICTFDVQAQNLISFGENKRDRCILVYSGIHYDRVVFSYSDPPHAAVTLPPEVDRTMWPTTDDEVLTQTHELVHKLNQAHYFTDTEGLILKCDVPGCGWIGSGQAEGSKHAQLTGHIELSEIKDIQDGNVLHQCKAPDCDFMGQGEKTKRQHTADTGHQKFDVIPDW